MSLRDSILDELLWHDGPGAFIDSHCDVCSENQIDALFRCTDCGHGSAILCHSCLIVKHQDLELHRIEVSSFFEF